MRTDDPAGYRFRLVRKPALDEFGVRDPPFPWWSDEAALELCNRRINDAQPILPGLTVAWLTMTETRFEGRAAAETGAGAGEPVTEIISVLPVMGGGAAEATGGGGGGGGNAGAPAQQPGAGAGAGAGANPDAGPGSVRTVTDNAGVVRTENVGSGPAGATGVAGAPGGGSGPGGAGGAPGAAVPGGAGSPGGVASPGVGSNGGSRPGVTGQGAAGNPAGATQTGGRSTRTVTGPNGRPTVLISAGAREIGLHPILNLFATVFFLHYLAAL